MKLSSLSMRTLSKIKNLNHSKIYYSLITATILMLGGFFYFNIVSAQTIVKYVTPTLINHPDTHFSFTSQQSKQAPKIDIANLHKSISLKAAIPVNEVPLPDPLKDTLTEILTGTPMENMIDPISKQDKLVAAFIVGIALKESGLGKHVPVLNGADCFNYWGYRGIRKRMGSGGHTCFDSPEDAVETIGKRLHTLAVTQKRTTPQKMLIWKCGSSCATHSPVGVAKWVSDVSIYFNKINNS